MSFTQNSATLYKTEGGSFTIMELTYPLVGTSGISTMVTQNHNYP